MDIINQVSTVSLQLMPGLVDQSTGPLFIALEKLLYMVQQNHVLKAMKRSLEKRVPT
jgi:predicted ATP-dependent protease